MLAVLDHFTLRVYVICHFWTPICNVLGYWRHRSICYTSLFSTPVVVTTIFFPVCYDPLTSYLGVVLWSRVICLVICLQCLYLGVSSRYLCLLCPTSVSPLFICLFFFLSVSYLLPLKYSVFAWNRRHLPSRLHFPLLHFPTIWLLRN
jgi:hypothetical protein